MEITDIKIRRIRPTGNIKAIVSVTFDNALVIHDMRVIENGNRTFAAMPSLYHRGTYRDIVHPITPELRAKINDEVIEEYLRAVEEIQGGDCINELVHTIS